MTSALALPTPPPRYASRPPAAATLAGEATELAARAGLNLDWWQGFCLEGMLAEQAPGRWATFETAICVSRQNGKNGVLEARELAGLYLIPTDRLIIHTAHRADTSLEAFWRLLMLIEQTPELDREVAAVNRAHGKEGITLKDGSRIRFRTRTSSGGRGFSGDLVVIDEAMECADATIGALMPTTSARPNPQIVYTASAVDQRIHQQGFVLARLRARGIAGDDPTLAYYEWSPALVGPDGRDLTPDEITPEVAADQALWWQSNPALDVRIRREHVDAELRSMALRTFIVERLNLGDWPDPLAGGGLIPLDTWQHLHNADSVLRDPVCFAIDVNPDRSYCSIAAAGASSLGTRAHVELVDRRQGTAWLPARAVELAAAHRHVAFVYDGASPASSLAPELEAAGLRLHPTTPNEHAQACGLLYDTVIQAGLFHLGSPEVEAAIRGAKTRPLGDGGFGWSRRQSSIDISPLVATTLALWGAVTLEDDTPGMPRVFNLNDL